MTQPINTEQSYLDFRRENPDFTKEPDIAVIFSGGMDSTTLVYGLLSRGYTPHLVSFNYGQRHKKELVFAERTAQLLGLRWDCIDLSDLTHLISNSALTSSKNVDPNGPVRHEDEIEVPEGHYAEDNMKLTVVPNRNMIMLSIAAGIAVNNGYQGVATAVHAGDHFVYPDCRPQFIMATSVAIVLGNEGFGSIPKLEPGTEVPQFIMAPYLEMSKADIAYEALKLKVPFENTWSCYKGDSMHCGKCGTCVERLEAIDEAIKLWDNSHEYQVNEPRDNTKYEDAEFWKTAVKK